MPVKDLKYYNYLFSKLRRDFKNGGAPHKPILLISVIQSFQNKIIKSNQIHITPELVGLFKSNWNALVKSNHQCLFTLPFYHMHTEPFWKLIPNSGCEIWVKSKNSMRSFSNLKTAIKYAEIELELYSLLTKKEESELLLNSILDIYFPNRNSDFNPDSDNYLTDIKNQILQEPHEDYKLRLLEIKNNLDNDAFQEEIYVRSSVFKKEVPKIYDYTCCISGIRIDVIENISMVDACHIVPFSESYNDTITNGIALCPNLHRAFDRGLISISNDFKVLVKQNFSEHANAYSIKQFEGKTIYLPKNFKLYPSLENLKSHRIKFEF